jgi:hypothetical protein
MGKTFLKSAHLILILFSIWKSSFSHDLNNMKIMCTDSIVFYEMLEIISPMGIHGTELGVELSLSVNSITLISLH